MASIKVEELAPARVACLRHTGPFGPALGVFWREVVAPWMREHGLTGRISYGVAMDDPMQTAPQDCRYDCCVEIGSHEPPPPPAALGSVGGGRYAILPFSGRPEAIGAAWQRFYTEDLPAAGLQARPAPCFERYAADFRADPQSGAFACELCIPVA